MDTVGHGGGRREFGRRGGQTNGDPLFSLSFFLLQISISLACKKAKREMSVREREKNPFSRSVANRGRTRLNAKRQKLRAINVREETERKKYAFDESIGR